MSQADSAAPSSDMLAIDRTRLAYERTLMAWIRTSTSLVTFGFTLYKAFQFLEQSAEHKARASVITPRDFAMIMMAIGTAALLVAMIQHWKQIHALRAHAHIPFSTALLVASLVATMGLSGLVAVVFRM